MNPFKAAPRRSRQFPLRPEALESRELLTGGSGDTFAIIPGTIKKAGDTVNVSFTIDPEHFTLPKGHLALGIDVVADPSAPNLKPFISSVTNPGSTLIPQTFHSIYDPHLLHNQVASGAGTSAVITPIGFFPKDPNKPATFTVQVTGEGTGTGKFLLGFYLPGDANGDGTVNQTDMQITRSEYGSKPGDGRYTFDADVNRDGRIGKVDLAYVRQNMGVKINVSPIVSANLDPTSVTDPTNRATSNPTATFTGTATPGATITFTPDGQMNPVGTTTANSMGNYSIAVPLVPGANVFDVASKDAFGQTITGKISPVAYVPKPVLL